MLHLLHKVSNFSKTSRYSFVVAVSMLRVVSLTDSYLSLYPPSEFSPSDIEVGVWGRDRLPVGVDRPDLFQDLNRKRRLCLYRRRKGFLDIWQTERGKEWWKQWVKFILRAYRKFSFVNQNLVLKGPADNTAWNNRPALPGISGFTEGVVVIKEHRRRRRGRCGLWRGPATSTNYGVF